MKLTLLRHREDFSKKGIQSSLEEDCILPVGGEGAWQCIQSDYSPDTLFPQTPSAAGR